MNFQSEHIYNDKALWKAILLYIKNPKPLIQFCLIALSQPCKQSKA